MSFDSSVLRTFSGFLGRISFDLKHFRVVVSLLCIGWGHIVIMVSLGLCECLLICDDILENFFLSWSDLLYIINCYSARLSFKFNWILTNFLFLIFGFYLFYFFVIIVEAASPLDALDPLCLRFLLESRIRWNLVPVFFEFTVSFTVSQG